MAARVARALAEDVGSALEVIINTPAQIVPLLWTAGIGVLLVLGREFFLEMCPILADNSVAVAVFIDAITFRLAFLWRKMALALEAVSLLTGHGDVVSQWIEAVDPSALKEFFTNAPIYCMPYDNVSTIMKGTFRSFAGTAVCPVLRYVYPQDFLFTLSNGLFGWMSYDPDPTGNNCEENDEMLAGCLALGAGYIVVEVFVPMILLALLLPLLKSVIKTLFVAAITAISWAIDIITAVQRKLTL